MKKYKQLFLGVLIGAILTIPAFSFAEEVIQKVEAVFAQYNFVVNGENKTLDADPLVYQGSTYLPVRTVSNLLGYDVTYKADSRTIELNIIKGDSMQNTVTQSVYNGTVSTQDQVTPISENSTVKEFVLYYDFSKSAKGHGNLMIDVISGKTRVRFDDKTYYINKNIDFYYDNNTGNDYFSLEFVSKLLPTNEIETIKKYIIDVQTGEITSNDH